VSTLLGIADAQILNTQPGQFKDTCVMARDKLEAAVHARFRTIELQLQRESKLI